ncbi:MULTISPECIES: carbonic anhydrase [Sutcliffiella]|uniref:carbonic anhydrase n=1 Tax=Sutcliffiella cohnii TaxID=33932 RepID=A0A223KL17_9BACI|nr:MULTISPECIES: carbonic anhydrase [Sutcliffiella]AST90058.1 carbonate dehydratase [Sutcliffiella cohnii]WBL15689.1 carbonate dehydratase [Sutcliffiella sp. NC1]
MEELELRKKNEEFIQRIKEQDPTFFDELKKGQTPEFFVLSCSDSRVSPSVITQMPLGHMFVHRNIANQVVTEDESFSASLYYALKHLKVKKIVIKGHTDCGGVKAAWLENDEQELQGWISRVRASLPDKSTKIEPVSLDELTKLNVLKQVERLMEHPIYKEYGTDIEVLGCLFHVESGELERVFPLEN